MRLSGVGPVVGAFSAGDSWRYSTDPLSIAVSRQNTVVEARAKCC